MARRKKWAPLAIDSAAVNLDKNTDQRLNRFVVELHAITHYENTQAPILDYYKRSDETIGKYSDEPIPYKDVLAGQGHKVWMQEKKKRLAEWTPILQRDDYTAKKPATCLPSRAALSAYMPFKKLFGERKYGGKYPSYTFKTSFMDLPAELRNRIYRMHLVTDEPIELLPKASQCYRNSAWRIGDHRWRQWLKLQKMLCPFLRVSKTVHTEASSIFYAENEFRFTGCFGWLFLRGFMDTIGPVNASHLRRVTVHIHWPGESTGASDEYNRIRELQRDVGREQKSMRFNNGMIKTFRNTPTSVRECLAVFEKAGKLIELNLVLPYAYKVKALVDLKLDLTKFEVPPKIRLLHLRRIENIQTLEFDEPDGTQMPLQKFKFTRHADGRNKSSNAVAEWKNPKTYAKAQGWEFEFMRYGQRGAYPERARSTYDPGDQLESDEDE